VTGARMLQMSYRSTHPTSPHSDRRRACGPCRPDRCRSATPAH
jgi:hypothetical protein